MTDEPSSSSLIHDLRANADLTEKALDFMDDPEQIEESKAELALWRSAAERIQRLEAGLEELLDVAERKHGGDPDLDPEQWYAARDYARVSLGINRANTPAVMDATERRVHLGEYERAVEKQQRLLVAATEASARLAEANAEVKAIEKKLADALETAKAEARLSAKEAVGRTVEAETCRRRSL